ncbi:MAG: DUF4835 family protein, partial [Proteiniphilum sp.]|nr:DUF4835 family protein [Proteiniphilum sp.]
MTGVYTLDAQELHAAVTVNSAQVQGSSRQLFSTLEGALHTFLNGQRWSDAPIPAGERLDCSFALVITERVAAGSFRGELYVHSRKKGEGGSPGSTLLSLRDKELDFSYTEYQPLSFDPYDIRDNLTAVIAYYVYLTLGLEGDAVAPLGGTPHFRNMELIATQVQSFGWRGWNLNSHSSNRTAIAAAFNDGSLEQYRQMWYRFHTEGAGKVNASPARQFSVAVSVLEELSSLHGERLGNVLLSLFGDAKLEELTTILSRGSYAERQLFLRRLREI